VMSQALQRGAQETEARSQTERVLWAPTLAPRRLMIGPRPEFVPATDLSRNGSIVQVGAA